MTSIPARYNREIERKHLPRRQEAKKALKSTDAVGVRAEIRTAELKLQRHVEFIGREGTRAPGSLMGEIERLEKRVAALQESLLPPAELPLEPPTEQEMRRHLEVIADALR